MSTTDFTHHASTKMAGQPGRLKTFKTNAMLSFISMWPPVAILAALPWLLGRAPLPSLSVTTIVAANVDAIIVALLYATVSLLFQRRPVLTYFIYLITIITIPLLIMGWGPGLHPVGVYAPICVVFFALALTSSFAVVVWLFDRRAAGRHDQAGVISAR